MEEKLRKLIVLNLIREAKQKANLEQKELDKKAAENFSQEPKKSALQTKSSS
jgi:hypothetical protein